LAGFLRRHTKHERAAFQLYGTAVTAARDPYLYETLGVPDTLDGRFDAVVLHVYLLVRRLSEETGESLPAETAARRPAGAELGPVMAQGVFDAMFLDMDINLREMGAGDMAVPRRNRAMWEAFHGRSVAYTETWDDSVGLAAAFARNLWRGAEPPADAASALVRLAHAQAKNLATQPLNDLLSGSVRFLSAQEAAQ
jgi:cytochrome b pre-mRNA-processing protein 3